MKKKQSMRQLAIRFNKETSKWAEQRPNIYAFLIDKGVDEGIAEAASEFILSDWESHPSEKFRKEILDRISALIVEMETAIEEPVKKLECLWSDIEVGLIR